MSVLVPSVVALLAGLTALHAGYRPLRQRMAWRVGGAGCVLWALLGGFEAARLGTDVTAPRALVHAGPFIIAVAGLAAALLVIASQTVDRDTGLDCLLMGVVLFGGAMEFLVYPLRGGATWTVAGQIALGMVAPVGAVGIVRARRRQDHLLLAALIAVCLAPAFVAARSVDEQSMDRWSFIPADAIFGLGWTVGFLLLGVGALYAARDLNDPVVTNFREHPRGRRIVSIPSVSIVLQLFIVHHTSVEPGVNVVVAGSMMVVTILIAVRLNAASRLVERLAERTLERNRLHTVVESSAAIVGAPDVSSLLRHVGDATARALNRDCVEVVYRPPFGTGQVVLIGTELSSERCAEALHQLIDERPSHHEPFVIHVAARELPADLATRWREAGKWTVLVIPMISEQELFGHVQVWTPFDRTDFPPEAVKTATTVVQEGSLAIQNARLLDVTRQRGNERALLLRVSQAAASSLDLPVVLGEIAQATLGVNAIESTSIELWDSSTDELIVGAQETIPEWPGVHPPGTRFGVDRWPLNRDALMGRDPVPFSVTTPELGPEAQQQMRLIGVGSGVLYPLLAGDERLGLLKVFSRSEDAFGPDDIRLGAEMSNQTALAIQNARLLEDERRRAEERAVLLRVSKAATSSLDLDTVLGEIADSTLGYGGIECTGIELWDRETNELIVGAQRTIPDWPGVDPSGKRYPVGFSEHEGRILNSRDSFTFNLSDPELGETRRNRMIASGTGSALIYPLWIGDQCLGMLDFFSRKERA
ncbi:MAG: hypothetical protein IT336_14420, partial [Thermomicrobiales bacterium]|nr:hypothetical protein [Thermomicrobiales bacterium]